MEKKEFKSFDQNYDEIKKKIEEYSSTFGFYSEYLVKFRVIAFLLSLLSSFIIISYQSLQIFDWDLIKNLFLRIEVRMFFLTLVTLYFSIIKPASLGRYGSEKKVIQYLEQAQELVFKLLNLKLKYLEFPNVLNVLKSKINITKFQKQLKELSFKIKKQGINNLKLDEILGTIIEE